MDRQISVNACVARVLLIALLLFGLATGRPARPAPVIPPRRSRRTGQTWVH